MSSIVDYPLYDDLVDVMKGSSSTSQWDVVASYAEDKLNEMLGEQYIKGNLVQNIDISTTAVDRHGQYPLIFSIKLGSPSIKFIEGSSSQCKLVMPIMKESTYKVDTDPEKEIPAETYNLICICPIVALSGDDQNVQPNDETIIFADDLDHSKYHVTLHFKNTGETIFKIDSKEDSEAKDYLNMSLIPELNTWFSENVNEIDYSLATINNEELLGDLVLKPKSFVFTTAKNGDNAVLSLYIQTEESGNDPGNLVPTFQPGGIQILPISDNHTASIILSHDLMAKSFFKKQIEKSGLDVEVMASSEGILLNLYSKNNDILNFHVISGSEKIDKDEIDSMHEKARSIPIIFTVKDSYLELNWEFSKRMKFTVRVVKVVAGEVMTNYKHGEFDLSIILNKTIKPSFDLHDNELKTPISITEKDYVTKIRPVDINWWNKVFTNETSKFNAKVDFDLPEMSVNIGTLNFFLTTNILFPNKQVIDVDKSIGVNVPYDLLIVGDIQENKITDKLQIEETAR